MPAGVGMPSFVVDVCSARALEVGYGMSHTASPLGHHGHQRPMSRIARIHSRRANLPPRRRITAPMAERSDNKAARPRVAASSIKARQCGSQGIIALLSEL